MASAALFTSPNFLAFVLVSVILAITPGPAVIYLLTQTISQGRKGGLASVAGIAVGNIGNASAASIGLAAVFAASHLAFTVVKLAGAAYLIFLGIRVLRTKSTGAAATGPGPRQSPRRLFRDGWLVALLNPKTALFYAALLPQFLDPGVPPLGQTLKLSAVFVTIALCTDTAYVLTAAAVVSTLRRRAVWRSSGRYLSALSFIGLGIYAALASPRSAK